MSNCVPIKTGNDFRKRSLALSKFFCLMAAVSPLLGATGWIFHIDRLKQIHSSLPAMQPNTVFGLVLSTIVISFTADGRQRWRDVACLLAVVISLLGLLTLAEYLFGWDLGIDYIFIRGSTPTGRIYTGRPSPQTAVNFAILGKDFRRQNLS